MSSEKSSRTGGVYGGSTSTPQFRRTWDRDEYAAKARERARREAQAESDEERKRKGLKPKPRAPSPDSQPKEFLRARSEKVVLDANLNRTQVVQSTSITSRQPGYYCQVCDCVVKDSVNYLDHINGKKHQRALGMSMKVERSTIDQVRSKLANLKAKKEQATETYGKGEYAISGVDA
ncbi:10379_t:CDS:2 [Paraglomus occultum]|uniref:10379_t:CDS:1 n=1 Tax=Paraglomus occultum TaxID=144539 RepID=A0A9N9B6D5_9GLOM|nr:10379_t:CDS:2 [Paraglomus occultum]